MVTRGRLTLFEARWPGGRALFTTRMGGASKGVFAGLNIDPRGGDDPEAVAANHAALLLAADTDAIFFPRQVHGGDVVQSGRAPGVVFGAEGDAVTTGGPGGAGVMTADCLGLVIRSAGAGVAAVHAGWRGIVTGIIGAAVARLGGDPGAMDAYLGPCIGRCCFEVGPEVAQALAATAGAQVVSPRGAKLHADLAGAAVLQLAAAGIDPGRISGVGLCTRCRDDLFYSHRRDRGLTGRMATVAILDGGEGR
jgi:YfiH family protein